MTNRSGPQVGDTVTVKLSDAPPFTATVLADTATVGGNHVQVTGPRGVAILVPASKCS